MPFRSAATLDVPVNTADWAIPVPAGVVDGDILFAFLVVNQTSPVINTGIPAGWTQVGGSTVSPGNDSRGYVFWKIASGEGATVTFTWSGGTNVSGAACMAAWSDPLGFDSGVAGNFASTTTPAGPALTPTVDGCMVVAFFGTDHNQAVSWTPPSGYTERVDFQDSGPLCTVHVADILQTTAAQETPTATLSAADEGVAFTVAIQPAAGGTQTITPAAIVVTTTVPAPTVSGPVSIPLSRANPDEGFQGYPGSLYRLFYRYPTRQALDVMPALQDLPETQVITPAAIAVNTTIPAPTVTTSGGQVISPQPVAVSVTVPQPAVQGSGVAVITPQPVAVQTTVPAPTVTAGTYTIVPAPVVVNVVVPAPVVRGVGTVTILAPAIPVVTTVPVPSLVLTAPAVVGRISLKGRYDPILVFKGRYDPIMALKGRHDPVITLKGRT